MSVHCWYYVEMIVHIFRLFYCLIGTSFLVFPLYISDVNKASTVKAKAMASRPRLHNSKAKAKAKVKAKTERIKLIMQT